ncbi:MAG: tol-pal system protein YbgF [Mesorhizobium sp.]|nr:tol-pal system protein YbgF [Mesorhizobium sp.]
MKLLSILCGILALPIAAAGPVSARESALPETVQFDDSPFEVFPLSAYSTEMTGGAASSDEPPLLLAQASDPRVVGLEEEIRQLNGRLEEMNFQILQMQESMRKMQEDVDFRLQEIEAKRTDAGGKAPSAAAPTKTAQAPTIDAPRVEAAPSQGKAARAAPAGTGAPERPLGTIVFDANGNVKGGELAIEPGANGSGEPPDVNTVVAALPSTNDPQELYRNSYEFILSGDYGTAEAGFREYIDRFPGDAQTADAHYWLGESLLGQQRYRDAAEVFVAANREFPNSRKSPDMLLKLGVSMAALNQHDVACATFGKIAQRYPQVSPSLKERVKQEQALAGC